MNHLSKPHKFYNETPTTQNHRSSGAGGVWEEFWIIKLLVMKEISKRLNSTWLPARMWMKRIINQHKAQKQAQAQCLYLGRALPSWRPSIDMLFVIEQIINPFRLTKALDQLITRWRVIERYQLLGEINRNDITTNYYQSLSIGLFLTGVTLGDRFYFSSLSAESHSLVPWTHWIRAKTHHRIPRNRIHQALLPWMSLRQKSKG